MVVLIFNPPTDDRPTQTANTTVWLKAGDLVPLPIELSTVMFQG